MELRTPRLQLVACLPPGYIHLMLDKASYKSRSGSICTFSRVRASPFSSVQGVSHRYHGMITMPWLLFLAA